MAKYHAAAGKKCCFEMRNGAIINSSIKHFAINN
jgi:hypothetical protein